MVLLDGRLQAGEVTIRPLVATDGEALFSHLSTDVEISRWTRIPWPYTRAHLDGFLSQIEAWRDAATDLVCAITVGDDDTLVGSCGIHRIGFGWQPGSSFIPNEVGYWLAAAQRGRGVMRRAVTALSRFGLADLGLDVLNLQTKVGNEASQGVARAVGYRYVSSVRGADLTDDDTDHDRFELRVDDYAQVNGPLVPWRQ